MTDSVRILLITMDHGPRIPWMPLSMAYLASSIRDRVPGAEIEIWAQDVNHYPCEKLQDTLESTRYDFVILSTISGAVQYQMIKKLSRVINGCSYRSRLKYQLGGHAASSAPDYFINLTKADCICVGEGEITTTEWINAEINGEDLHAVKGIVFIDHGNIVHNQPRPVVQDIDSLPFPAYDLFNMSVYRLKQYPGMVGNEFSGQMLSGRGCKYQCNFCYRIDKGLRLRSTKMIVKEMEYLKETYGISYISFNDELLMSSRERVFELCEGFVSSGLNMKWWCNGRLNHADKDVLDAMKSAGCQFVNYGVESLDDSARELMNKQLTINQIYNGIENTIASGIIPGINIIYGNINEPISAIERGVEFLLKYNDWRFMRTIRPVTPYPGTELFSYAIKTGQIESIEDFFENKCVNADLLSVNLTGEDLEKINSKLAWANKVLIRAHSDRIAKERCKQIDSLYLDNNAEFRGFEL